MDIAYPPFELPVSVTDFSDYFKLSAEPELIADALGYGFAESKLSLPAYTEPLVWASELSTRLEALRLNIGLGSEIARREYLIAPLLIEISVRYGVKLRSEYPVKVSERLQGTLDYLAQSKTQLLIVEAKQENTDRGASQLVAEMVALDQWTTTTAETLYGALSTGQLWQFVALRRNEKRFERDTFVYPVPQNLPDLIAVIMGILQLP